MKEIMVDVNPMMWYFKWETLLVGFDFRRPVPKTGGNIW